MTSASFRTTSVLATLLVGAAGLGVSAHEKAQEFYMVRAAKPVASGCLPNASATVRIKPKGPVEVMDVFVEGLPANTDFDFFVIQKPGAPFGLAWYQGDIETNEHGRGFGRFIGRFNEETFIVATGSVPAPIVHNNAFPDASTNPFTNPVHTFHLGLWFNSPDDAVNGRVPRGCHAVQRRAQCRHSGVEHQQLRGSDRPAVLRQAIDPRSGCARARPATRPSRADACGQRPISSAPT